MESSAKQRRLALAAACEMAEEKDVVWRAEGVRRLANGSEPDAIWLRVYVNTETNDTLVPRKLELAVRGGEVGRLCKQHIIFRGSRQLELVEDVALMFSAIYDLC